VHRVSDIINEITSASQEQSVGIDQINQAVMQMDTVTQQNAALVEEAAAAASSMQEQASTLSQAVSVFRLSEQERIAARSAVVTRLQPRSAAKPVGVVAPRPARATLAKAANGGW